VVHSISWEDMSLKKKQQSEADMVDVLEEMLCQRAMNGFRPVLYVSSFTDLECNMLMLLDETADWPDAPESNQPQSGVGYHITMN
jgi:hypothetical protein